MSSRRRALAAFALTAAVASGGCAARAGRPPSTQAAPNTAVPVRHHPSHGRPNHAVPQTRHPTTRP